MNKKVCMTVLGVLISTNLFAGTLKVGASPVPHAELLNYLKKDWLELDLPMKR